MMPICNGAAHGGTHIAIEAFVDCYDNLRYHKDLNNLTPATAAKVRFFHAADLGAKCGEWPE